MQTKGRNPSLIAALGLVAAGGGLFGWVGSLAAIGETLPPVAVVVPGAVAGVALVVAGFGLARRAIRGIQADVDAAAEARLLSVLDGAPIGATINRPGGTRLYANPSMATLIGYPSPAEMMKGSTLASFADRRQFDALEAAALAHGIATANPVERRRVDGGRLFVDLRLQRIVWQGAPALVGWAVDVTRTRAAISAAQAALAELRATQDQLVRREKLSSLGELVAGVAHEINTPVGVALTAGTLLEEEQRELGKRFAEERLSAEDLTAFLDICEQALTLIVTNCRRAADLVQSFKRVAVDQASEKRRVFDLDALVREVLISLGPLFQRGQHRVTLAIDPGLILDSFPGPLTQALAQLLTNAVTHGFQGQPYGTVAIAATSGGPGWITLSLADDGQGIAADTMSKIYDPFFTTARSRGNTGLGLHVVHALVTGPLGGRIDVESAPGTGTRFTLALPVRAPETEAPPAGAPTTA